MTNEMIIFNQRCKLMKEGKLNGTGRMIEAEFEDGKRMIKEPAEIHTFAGWKDRGYQVKKGEKSEIKFAIWKHTKKEKKPNEITGNPITDAPIENMFLKMSCFFTPEQVQPIKQ